MDFVETRMLNQLDAHDAIVAAKTDQAYHANKARVDTKDLDIKVDSWVLIRSEYLKKEKRAARKLLQRWKGPYRVLWIASSNILYKLDLGLRSVKG
jgi:hypothetical protein